ncbi:MAG TPA: type II toxin-antitoxin system VapC family toxin [Polyangiaceae bacterium]
MLDTHVWVKFVAGTSLSKRARVAIERAATGGRDVLIPAISLWEIARLAQDGRVRLGERPERWFDAALATVSGSLAAITPEIAIVAAGLHCQGDPADRLIIATALARDAILVTRDGAILDLAGARKELRVLEA